MKDPVRIFEFVSAHQAQHRVATMCRVLDVSASGYYAWRKRPASKRAQEDGVLCVRSARSTRPRGSYGVPRVHEELRENGVEWGRDRVARLMRAAGLQGMCRRRVTDPCGTRRPAPDLVERRFAATEPNQLWVADITYIPTWAGFCIRGRARRLQPQVVGWAMEAHLRTELVLQALERATSSASPRG